MPNVIRVPVIHSPPLSSKNNKIKSPMIVATTEVNSDFHNPLTCKLYTKNKLTEDTKQHSFSSKVASLDVCTKSTANIPSHRDASETVPRKTKRSADTYIVSLVSSKSDDSSDCDNNDITYKDLIGFN